ncbi:MAG: hypothetical protein AB7E46_12060 [Desulfovibrio sp.]|jgi:hypothetical protein
MTGYPYARPGLLEQPCHYMYPPYGGPDFLRAWATDRQRAMAALEDVLAAVTPGAGLALPGACLARLEALAGPQEGAASRILRQSAAAVRQAAAPAPALPEPDAEVALAPLVRGLLLRAASGLADDSDSLWLARLARKFEVAKRLFPAYQPHPRHGLGAPLDPDADNRDIRLHALLAAALGLCGGPDTDLVRLNAQLKLNDALCSELPALSGQPEAAGLALLSLRAEAWRVAGLSPEDAPWL